MEDISRKFIAMMEGKTDSPVHFLGAMVFDQKQTPITHVVKRQVIDGQQRLTTFQIFLAAFRDFCTASGCSDVAAELQQYIFNKGMMPNPDTDKFKVWPTQADRRQVSRCDDQQFSCRTIKAIPRSLRKNMRVHTTRDRKWSKLISISINSFQSCSPGPTRTQHLGPIGQSAKESSSPLVL